MYRNENYFPRTKWNMLNMMSHTLGVHFEYFWGRGDNEWWNFWDKNGNVLCDGISDFYEQGSENNLKVERGNFDLLSHSWMSDILRENLNWSLTNLTWVTFQSYSFIQNKWSSLNANRKNIFFCHWWSFKISLNEKWNMTETLLIEIVDSRLFKKLSNLRSFFENTKKS